MTEEDGSRRPACIGISRVLIFVSFPLLAVLFLSLVLATNGTTLPWIEIETTGNKKVRLGAQGLCEDMCRIEPFAYRSENGHGAVPVLICHLFGKLCQSDDLATLTC